jgi:AcrR family transcriptional regulator
VPRNALTDVELHAFREQICKVATQIFAEKGAREVTMRAIAAEMRCSPMKLYHYFENKEAIFDQIRRTTYRSLTETAARAVNGITDPAASLAAFGEVYIGFALENPDVYRILFEVPQSKSSTASEISEDERKGWEQLCGLLKQAIDAGFLSGDPTTLAHMFWAAVHGLLSLHLADKLRYGESLQGLVRPMINTLIAGSRGSARAEPAASNEAPQEKRSVKKRRSG